MPRDGYTIRQIADHDTRMGRYMRDVKQACDDEDLSSYSFMEKAGIIADIANTTSILANIEHDRIVSKMNPVNVNVWYDQHNIADMNVKNIWLELPSIDAIMDNEAYDAKDALNHIMAIRRIFANGPEIYRSVQRTAAIGNHDTAFFMDMSPSALHDLINRAWYDVGCGRELDRLIIEKYIFSTLMNDFQKAKSKDAIDIISQISDEDLHKFALRLRNRFRG